MSVKIEADGQHYPECPCGKCYMIRKDAYDTLRAAMTPIERVQETLTIKIEYDGKIPARGLFNCSDIAELVKLVSDK